MLGDRASSAMLKKVYNYIFVHTNSGIRTQNLQRAALAARCNTADKKWHKKMNTGVSIAKLLRSWRNMSKLALPAALADFQQNRVLSLEKQSWGRLSPPSKRLAAHRTLPDSTPRRRCRNARRAYAKLRARFLQTARLHNHLRDHVRIHVRRRAPVLEVPVLLGLRVPRNPHRAPTVRDAVGELVDRGGLVRTRQPPLVPLAVGLDVLHVLRRELLHRRDDLAVGLVRLSPRVARVAHANGREVRVAAGAVPVARPRLRVESHSHLEILTDPLHDVARHPHMVAAVDANTRPDLVLPLARHHLRVRSGDGQPSAAAVLVVRLRDGAAKGHLVAAAAVVGALRTLRLALVREAERDLLPGLEERVLLLNAEPRHLRLRLLHHLQARRALVPLHGLLRFRVEALAPNQLVRGPAERIVEDGHRTDQDFRVGPWGLLRRRPVVVPDRQLGGIRRDLVHRLRLGADVEGAEVLALTPAEPAVLQADLTTVLRGHRDESACVYVL